jgi:hypothetical protein
LRRSTRSSTLRRADGQDHRGPQRQEPALTPNLAWILKGRVRSSGLCWQNKVNLVSVGSSFAIAGPPRRYQPHGERPAALAPVTGQLLHAPRSQRPNALRACVCNTAVADRARRFTARFRYALGRVGIDRRAGVRWRRATGWAAASGSCARADKPRSCEPRRLDQVWSDGRTCDDHGAWRRSCCRCSGGSAALPANSANRAARKRLLAAEVRTMSCPSRQRLQELHPRLRGGSAGYRITLRLVCCQFPVGAAHLEPRGRRMKPHAGLPTFASVANNVALPVLLLLMAPAARDDCEVRVLGKPSASAQS